MMIVYYYVIWLKRKGKVEIHMIPFKTKDEAEKYKIKADKYFKETIIQSKVRKTNLSKFENGLLTF